MDLKPITAEGVPAALQKAERYRLLNDSSAAESICLDVLEVDPTNQQALISLLLSITDQFVDELGDVQRAREILPRITDAYKRAYYSGIICERRGRAQLHRGSMGSADIASEWFHEAMGCYEQAEQIRPRGNDESILRWNTCVRMLNRHERVSTPRDYEPALDD